MKYISILFVTFLTVLSSCVDSESFLPRLSAINIGPVNDDYPPSVTVRVEINELGSNLPNSIDLGIKEQRNNNSLVSTGIPIEKGWHFFELALLQPDTKYNIELRYSEYNALDGTDEPIVLIQSFISPKFSLILLPTEVNGKTSLKTVKTDIVKGSLKVETYGHVWSLNNSAPDPNLTSNKQEYQGITPENFVSTFSFVDPSVTYYVWAYVKTGTQINYSAVTVVAPNSNSEFSIVVSNPYNIQANGVSFDCDMVINSGSTNYYGLVASSSIALPSVNNYEHIDENFTTKYTNTSFAVSYLGLQANTLYYVRPFISDGIITRYGNVKTVLTGSPNEAITVTSPISGVIYRSSAISITWTSSFSEAVDIELYKGSSLARVIVTNVSNNGTHTWSVPSDLAVGDYYRIRIFKTSDNTVEHFGSEFKIQ